MARIIFLILLGIGALHLARDGNFEALTDFSSSKESLQQKLDEKVARRNAISSGLKQAQANAPSCGGRPMRLVVSEETKAEVRQLDQEILELRRKIAQK